MLSVYAGSGVAQLAPADLKAAKLPADAVWIDLLKPTADETSFIERGTGLRLPTFDDLSEIESSSRLRSDGRALYLSTPLVYRATADQPLATPVGLVLLPERLVTVRFEPLTAFTTFSQTPPPASAGEAFAGLVEAIVDRIADVLE